MSLPGGLFRFIRAHKHRHHGHRLLSTRADTHETPPHLAAHHPGRDFPPPLARRADSLHLGQDTPPRFSERDAPPHVAEQVALPSSPEHSTPPHVAGPDTPPRLPGHETPPHLISQPYFQPLPPHINHYNRDRPPDYKFFRKRLTWLLRHGATQQGLPMRPDGFVRASDVKACSRFSYLSSADFDELFWKDPVRRFTIIQDFDVRQGADTIWIRSRGVHSIKGVNLHVIRKIRSPEELPMAIYPLRPEEWKRVERHGIQPSEADGFIHLIRSSRSQNFAHGSGATFGVCIYLDVEKMLSSGIRLFKNHKNEVLTSGDRDNILPPHLFKKVVRIQVEKETLLLQ